MFRRKSAQDLKNIEAEQKRARYKLMRAKKRLEQSLADHKECVAASLPPPPPPDP